MVYIQALSTFWMQHPALLYGLSFLIGCSIALQPQWIYLLPSFILWSPFLKRPAYLSTLVRQFLALLVMISGIVYTKGTIQHPDEKLGRTLEGDVHFSIESITLVSKHYGKAWRYKGRIRSFYLENELTAFNLPATMQLPLHLDQPDPDHSYFFSATLKQVTPFKYVLIPDPKKPWHVIANRFSMVKMRYHAKKFVSEYIHKHIQDTHTAAFLTGITTGDFQDNLINYEFNRFGLQHIMAISGFHFAIIAAILNFILSLLLPYKKSTWLLIVFLTLYFVFLGNSPSIMRAWISSTLFLFGTLIGKKSNGLNLLGVGLLTILIYDPLAITNMGFQFSFAATAAILMIYPAVDRSLQMPFPKRPLSTMIQMNIADQHAYTLLSWCRQAIALMFAVNSAALPLTFFYFLKFPLMGLLYNLFFPFMVSIAMVLLIVATGVGILWMPLGQLLHAFNEVYTKYMLSYTYNLPSTLDYYLRVSPFSPALIIVELSILFILGILTHNASEKRWEEIYT